MSRFKVVNNIFREEIGYKSILNYPIMTPVASRLRQEDTGSPPMTEKRKNDTSIFLLGIGLDNDDGHYRLTRGKAFHLVGGSETTHRKMQDKMMELSDDLAKKGKDISDIGLDDMGRVSDILRG